MRSLKCYAWLINDFPYHRLKDGRVFGNRINYQNVTLSSNFDKSSLIPDVWRIEICIVKPSTLLNSQSVGAKRIEHVTARCTHSIGTYLYLHLENYAELRALRSRFLFPQTSAINEFLSNFDDKLKV